MGQVHSQNIDPQHHFRQRGKNIQYLDETWQPQPHFVSVDQLNRFPYLASGRSSIETQEVGWKWRGMTIPLTYRLILQLPWGSNWLLAPEIKILRVLTCWVDRVRSNEWLFILDVLTTEIIEKSRRDSIASFANITPINSQRAFDNDNSQISCVLCKMKLSSQFKSTNPDSYIFCYSSSNLQSTVSKRGKLELCAV